MLYCTICHTYHSQVLVDDKGDRIWLHQVTCPKCGRTNTSQTVSGG